MHSQLHSMNAAVRASWGAAIFAIASMFLQARNIEVQSEVICCTFLSIVCLVAKSACIPPPKEQSSTSLWVVATCAAISSLCFAEGNGIIFFPILYPLFCIFTKRRKIDQDLESTTKLPLSTTNSTTMGRIVTALCCVVSLFPARPYDIVLSVVSSAAILTALFTLSRSTNTRAPSILQSGHALGVLTPIALRTYVALCGGLVLQIMLYGYTPASIASMTLLGTAKALSWYFSTVLSQWTSWNMIPAIWTYAIMCARSHALQRSTAQSCLHIVSCLLSLTQMVQTLPKSLKGRSTLWALSAIALAPYIATQWSRLAARNNLATERYQQTHPVELLIRRANADFESFITKQSQSYDLALTEYRRRYKMDPPDGFEAWYNFARLHNSVVIDDFDTLYKGISPFWEISGREYVEISNQLKHVPNIELWTCDFSGNNGHANCLHAYRSFDRHFGDLLDTVPGHLRRALTNVSVLVNHLDEPRVMIPSKIPSNEARDRQSFHQINLKHTPTWSTLTRSCVWDTKQTIAMDKSGLPFVHNKTADLDLCQHGEYGAMHGLFLSPTSFSVVDGLVPILSTGAPSTMGDILFPSPAYTEPEFGYDEAHDYDWARKANKLYWAGSTSGGYAGKRWPQFHRQRFVSFVQNLSNRLFYYLHENKGILTKVASSFLDIRLYDVLFTRIYQCERRYCRDQDMFFNMGSWAGKDQAFKSRLVFDTDGNGISGRYYKLLASKSAPLKQTLLREWHDDRLVPWVHYIPVSQDMGELPELVSFLTSTELGQQRASEIAEQGRQWSSKALREIDMSIYMYRLLLEIARLQDIQRDA